MMTAGTANGYYSIYHPNVRMHEVINEVIKWI